MCSHHLNKLTIRQPRLTWLCEGTSVGLCPRRVDRDRRSTKADSDFSIHYVIKKNHFYIIIWGVVSCARGALSTTSHSYVLMRFRSDRHVVLC